MHDCRLNERGNLLSEGKKKKSISSLECALDCLQDWCMLEFLFLGISFGKLSYNHSSRINEFKANDLMNRICTIRNCTLMTF